MSFGTEKGSLERTAVSGAAAYEYHIPREETEPDGGIGRGLRSFQRPQAPTGKFIADSNIFSSERPVGS